MVQPNHAASKWYTEGTKTHPDRKESCGEKDYNIKVCNNGCDLARTDCCARRRVESIPDY